MMSHYVGSVRTVHRVIKLIAVSKLQQVVGADFLGCGRKWRGRAQDSVYWLKRWTSGRYRIDKNWESQENQKMKYSKLHHDERVSGGRDRTITKSIAATSFFMTRESLEVYLNLH